MANTVISGDIIDQKRKEKCFDVALQTRNFEIDLFWKRSLFFWGFIAAAFTAYSLLSKPHPNLCIVIACFGTVCSLAWTFLNRSSKFWQEVWENEVKAVQCDVVGKDIFREPDIKARKGFWGSAKFSPSKLTIALSDYVTLVWFCLLLYRLIVSFLHPEDPCLQRIAIALFTLTSFVFAICIFSVLVETELPHSNNGPLRPRFTPMPSARKNRTSRRECGPDLKCSFHYESEIR